MKLSIFIISSFLCFSSYAQDNVPASIYDFKVPSKDGGTIDLSQYRGKKILIVNTPVDDDVNPFYSELETLYNKEKDRLVIIAFPDPCFLIRPGSHKDPNLTPAQMNYNVTFPMTTKVQVRTDQMAPIYKWLTQAKYNKFKDSEVKWDFQKYLINEQGQLVAVFDPKIRPANHDLVAAIER